MKQKKIKDLGIVIPAFNESKTIKRAAQISLKFGEVCIVNDSSTDNTKKILRKNNINHINNTKQ